VNDMQQASNINAYASDDLEMYGRRENLRVIGVAEDSNFNDDGEAALLQIADELVIELRSSDLQRAHWLGKKKTGSASKPRPIIACFVSYKKRQQFMYAKGKLRDSTAFKDSFIVEDLTSLRAKLLRCVKHECDGKFVNCHKINGRIRMKKICSQVRSFNEAGSKR